MARRRTRYQPIDIWPGFVDALSTLLLSVIFLLVVFVLGQFFLGQMLQGRDQTVQQLQGQVKDLGGRLELEQDAAAELRRTLSRLNADLQQAFADRDDAASRLANSAGDRDRQGEQLTRLTTEQARLQRALDAAQADAASREAQAADLRKTLEQAQQSVTADRATIEVQLGQLAQLRQDLDALRQARADLEGQVATLSTAQAAAEGQRKALAEALGSARDQASALEAQVATEEERSVLAQRELEQRDLRLKELEDAATDAGSERGQKEQALAQARTLLEQITTLSRQLQALDQALGTKQLEITRQNGTIADLGQRLNTALASKVEELAQYRSDFFGRLRQVLGTTQGVQVVGDRFVLQSEVLFDSGAAELNPAGAVELAKLATTLRDLTRAIPGDLPWVLQVDGHTDKRRIANARFPSNWELSAARAIAVAKFLVTQGLPADRVAARGFAEFQPLDPGDSEAAYRRNRRIEIKLTTR